MSNTTTSAKPVFWKPGTARPPTGSTLDRASESDSSLLSPIISSTPSSSNSSSTLPIFTSRLTILHAIETHQVVILISPTASGKSTLLPQILLSSGWSSPSHHGIIAVTQPRRLAAVSLASHVSTILGTPLGQEVGYSIRFEDNSSSQTKIKYLTDGTLFRELVKDPLLTRYSVVIVDEAHERGVWTDLLLGVLKKVMRRRKELRVIVSSATIDAVVFKDFFSDSASSRSGDGREKEQGGGVKVIQLESRSFPVHTAYLTQPCSDYVTKTVETIHHIHLTEPQGDILAFLTGREEIEHALQLLSDSQSDLPTSAARMHLLPLHSGLSASEQSTIFDPSPSTHRKVVIATNIAETSITIPSITYVVDCGYVKLRTLHPTSGVESLGVVPISRASAAQRAGRAGRVREGKCFRLYTEQHFREQMRSTTAPELNRVGLEGVVLMLKNLGVDNLVKFDWVPPSPPPELLARALGKLVELGALDDYARLTERGGWMGELPLAPHLGRILISSAEEGGGGCAQEMLSILAMTQVTSPFYAPQTPQTQLSIRSFTAQQGDPFTLLNVFLAFTDQNIGKHSSKWCTKHRLNFQALSRAISIRTQLEKFLLRFNSFPTPTSRLGLNPKSSALGREDAVERITKTLAKGLYPNLARYDEAKMNYTAITAAEQVWPHPTSVLFNRRPDRGKKWVVFGEAVRSKGGGEAGQGGERGERKTYIRDITVLDELEWVTEAVPGFYDIKTQFGRGGGSSAIPIDGRGERDV